MREQTLAGILGVAGPSPALGFLSAQPLSMVSLANDRPAGAWQAGLPLSVLVRSDFSAAFLSAVNSLQAQGATLPCVGPTTLALPPGGPGAVVPSDLLLYTGRVLTLAGSAALSTADDRPPCPGEAGGKRPALRHRGQCAVAGDDGSDAGELRRVAGQRGQQRHDDGQCHHDLSPTGTGAGQCRILYPPSVVAASALAPVLGYRWNGTIFAP
jgi:hypothetical protein